MTNREAAGVEAAFASIKLEGARFDGAKIPVESLQELLRYRELIVAAAAEAWRKDHPGEVVPSALADSLALTLTEVIDGSSVPLLDRPVESDFDEFFEDGKDDVDQLLRNVIKGGYQASAFPAWADINAFWDFGATLQPEEVMLVPAPTGSARPHAEISPVNRTQYFSPLQKKVNASTTRMQGFGVVTGKITALNAESRNFNITTEHQGNIHGRFKTVDITSDLKMLLGNSTEAPNAIVLGRLGYKEDTLEKIHEATIAVLEADPFARVVRRLATIAEAGDSWLTGEGTAVPFKNFTLGSKVIAAIQASQLTPPRVFPTEEGGLSFEWASASYVLSIEVEADSTLVAYRLPPGATTGTEVIVDAIDDLPQVLETWEEARHV